MSSEAKKIPYKHLYDNYVDNCYLGAMEMFFIPMSPSDRGERLPHPYILNKNYDELTKRFQLHNSFWYTVFDHIRIIGEVLSGIFTSTNDEFNLIIHKFLPEFVMHEVYIIYSPEFKDFELQLAATKAVEEGMDPISVLEKAVPECPFRLLRRTPKENGRFGWDTVLTGLKDVDIDLWLHPEDETRGNNKKTPIRCSFNDGFMWNRLFEHFKSFESKMQVYYKTFLSLHKVGEISAETQQAVFNKIHQFQCTETFTFNTESDIDSSTTVQNLELVEKIPNLQQSYDQIMAWHNDQMARFGFAGDESTKAERETTGENFRALMPNMSFQQTILQQLNNVSKRLSDRFAQDVDFTNNLEPNKQGIPQMVNRDQYEGR